MSATAALLTQSWKVGSRVCTVSIPQPEQGRTVHLTIEWAPTMPKRLSRSELRQYRRGRNAALAAVGAHIGGPVMVLEV
jgi:hypothetical protein